MRRGFAVSGLTAVATLAFTALAGCAPVVISRAPAATAPSPDLGVAQSDSPWASLPHCPGADRSSWQLVPDFPADALDAAGLHPTCGDVWLQDDGDTFVSIAEVVTEGALDNLGTALEARRFVKLVDDFAPATPGVNERGAVGARDYYLEGYHDAGFTRVAIELYSNGTTPATYTAFIDYLSPSTRALAPRSTPDQTLKRNSTTSPSAMT
jgi:hypothetical protein